MRITVNKQQQQQQQKQYIGGQITAVDYEINQLNLDTSHKNRKSLGLTTAGFYIGSLE